MLFLSIGLPAEEYSWQLPPGFPEPQVPDDNPMSVAKVELGRHLFYETRLSINNEYSCASCHMQGYAFTDQQKTATGATGEGHSRNSMSLTNVAYNATYTWADPGLKTLEQQVHIPLFNDAPLELGLGGREAELVSVLNTDEQYKKLFIKAFPGDTGPATINNIIRSLASFVRTLISGDSAYDRLVYLDERTAMDDSAIRGMRLFFSDRMKCAECHSGFNFSGPVIYKDSKRPDIVFHNNGLPQTEDKGVYKLTKMEDDIGRFRAPTLRNIALTGPYMHDGSLATLDEVVEHYAEGGFPNRGKSKLVTGFEITRIEKQDVKNFLESLTDRNFLNNLVFAAPGKSK